MKYSKNNGTSDSRSFNREEAGMKTIEQNTNPWKVSKETINSKGDKLECEDEGYQSSSHFSRKMKKYTCTRSKKNGVIASHQEKGAQRILFPV